jgi:hypothetical protein
VGPMMMTRAAWCGDAQHLVDHRSTSRGARCAPSCSDRDGRTGTTVRQGNVRSVPFETGQVRWQARDAMACVWAGSTADDIGARPRRRVPPVRFRPRRSEAATPGRARTTGRYRSSASRSHTRQGRAASGRAEDPLRR